MLKSTTTQEMHATLPPTRREHVRRHARAADKIRKWDGTAERRGPPIESFPIAPIYLHRKGREWRVGRGSFGMVQSPRRVATGGGEIAAGEWEGGQDGENIVSRG